MSNLSGRIGRRLSASRHGSTSSQQHDSCSPARGSPSQPLPTVPPHSSPHTPGTSASSVAGGTKRGRGTAKCRQLMLLREDEQLEVDIECGGGVGVHGDLFTSYQGMLCRMYCDLWEKDFKKTLTEEQKESIFRDLTRYFKITRTPAVDVQILSKMGEIHRKRRSYLKRRYFKERPFEEAIANVPEDVDADQWKMACEYWNRKEEQDVAVRNASNRSQLESTYKRGRTSINQIKSRFRNKEGRDPTRPEIFQLTHSRTSHDGSQIWVDDQSREKMDRMKELMAPPQDNDVVVPSVSPDDAFVQVMGPDRPGRVRCAGRGETLKTWYGGGSVEGRNNNSQHVQHLKNELSELKNQLVQQQEDSCHQIQSMKTEMDSMREAFMKQIQEMKEMMFQRSQ